MQSCVNLHSLDVAMIQICPQCSNEVPDYAKVCKHCFYDFAAKPERKFPLGLSMGLFLISVVAMFGTQHLASSQIVKRYNLFPESQSLLIASASKDGITADRISFANIEHIEHISGGELHSFEIVAVVNSGERILLQGSEKSLSSQAEEMSRKTDLILKKINNRQTLQ
jgi:ribosomal protein L40E